MHFDAPDLKSRTRLQGAMLALLVQAALVTAALLSLTRPFLLPRSAQREATLWLRPLPQIPTSARTIDARGVSRRRTTITPVIKAPESLPPAPGATPSASDLQAFGRALFGCAPENYAALSPEDRAHCSKPGEGLAYQPPDPMGGPSHVKNNARWANALAHEQSQLLLPGSSPAAFGLGAPIALLGAILNGSIADPTSSYRDPEKWPSYVDPDTLMPKDLHDQDREYEAFRKDHPVK